MVRSWRRSVKLRAKTKWNWRRNSRRPLRLSWAKSQQNAPLLDRCQQFYVLLLLLLRRKASKYLTDYRVPLSPILSQRHPWFTDHYVLHDTQHGRPPGFSVAVRTSWNSLADPVCNHSNTEAAFRCFFHHFCLHNTSTPYTYSGSVDFFVSFFTVVFYQCNILYCNCNINNITMQPQFLVVYFPHITRKSWERHILCA